MRTLKWWVLFVVAIWFAGEAVAQTPQGKQKNSGINKNGGQVGQIQKGTAGKTVPGKKAKFAGKAIPANQGNLKKRPPNGGVANRRLPVAIRSGEGDVVATIIEFLDIDQDHKISQSEAPEKLLMHWDVIDTNADQFLDQVEIKSIVMRIAAGKGDSVIVGAPGKTRRPGKLTDKAAKGDGKLPGNKKRKGKGKD